MLTVVHSQGEPALATVHVVALADGARVECVESIQPPVPREEKWVLIVSTLRGCPVRCPICDAGGRYGGRLTAEEILAQVDHLVRLRYPDGAPRVRRLKVQLARMGDPAFNDAVLDVLEALPRRYPETSVMPSVSTIAPVGREAFFERLAGVKDRLYDEGRFQLQLSLHTTCEEARLRLVPARTWSFSEMGAYGVRFRRSGDRKVTLNFAAARELPLEPEALLRHFPPDHFLVKLTPINPTAAAERAGLSSLVDPRRPAENAALAERFRSAGYDTLLSIGELAENRIGSNCGMYVAAAAIP